MSFKKLDPPRPEQVYGLVHFGDPQRQAKETFKLSVGVAVRTETEDGLRIIPTHEVYFEVEKDGVVVSVAIPASMCLDLMKAQEAHIKYCEAQNSELSGRQIGGF